MWEFIYIPKDVRGLINELRTEGELNENTLLNLRHRFIRSMNFWVYALFPLGLLFSYLIYQKENDLVLSLFLVSVTSTFPLISIVYRLDHPEKALPFIEEMNSYFNLSNRKQDAVVSRV